MPLYNYGTLEFKPSDIVDCEVVSIQSSGLIGEFGLQSSGFIQVKYFRHCIPFYESLEEGDHVSAEIMEFSVTHRRYALRYSPE